MGGEKCCVTECKRKDVVRPAVPSGVETVALRKRREAELEVEEDVKEICGDAKRGHEGSWCESRGY